MPEPCTPESDVLDVIQRLEAEARRMRRQSDDAISDARKRNLVRRVQKLEELIAYLRARLP